MTLPRYQPVIYGALSLVAIVVLLVALVYSTSDTSEPRIQQQWQTGWQKARPFSIPRRAHAAVVANGYLYVIGGIGENDAYIQEVEYAKILGGGALGPWRLTSRLQEGRFYLAAVTKGNFLYAIGGANGPRGGDNVPIASVERAEIHLRSVHDYATPRSTRR